MIYLFPSGDSFSKIYDSSTLTDEQKEKAIVVNSLPKGDGILKRADDGSFFFEPYPIQEIIEQPETLEQKIERLEKQIQQDNIIQFEVLATIYEELLMKG